MSYNVQTTKPPLDAVNQAIVDKITERFHKGCVKYGTTIEGADKSVIQWIDEVQEELLDALVYIEKLKQVLGTPVERPKKTFSSGVVAGGTNPALTYPYITNTNW